MLLKIKNTAAKTLPPPKSGRSNKEVNLHLLYEATSPHLPLPSYIRPSRVFLISLLQHLYMVVRKTTPTVSQQIVLQCVTIKLVLLDLSVTHVVSHKHI